jgi:prephenate dehydrogenase
LRSSDHRSIVAILGVGLIGGSVARALRAQPDTPQLIGFDRRDPADLHALNTFDSVAHSLEDATQYADLIIIGATVDSIAHCAKRAAAASPAHSLITDVGSTKAQIVADVEADPLARAKFVGAHPIAGSEQKGPSSATANLFTNRLCILTPTPQTPPDRLQLALDFWSNLGCRIQQMTPSAHDSILASLSHLPHIAAAALAALIPPDQLQLAGGAYRDATRVALSDPDMWIPIFLQNRDAILSALREFDVQLRSFQSAIQNADAHSLRELWNKARDHRLQYQDPAPADPRQTATPHRAPQSNRGPAK